MPNYHEMSLVDLKQVAKSHTPKIKQYYIKSRIELIQILNMTELPSEMIIAKKTLAELRKEAQEKKYPNIWKLRRSEIVELLYPTTSCLGPKQDNKNNNSGKEHNHPQKGESDEVGIHILKDSK
jgi:hypothetical protein